MRVKFVRGFRRILLISGATEASELLDAAHAKGVGFDVVAKPVPPAELLERLSALLNSPVIET